jgi:oligoendopeptidase F
VDRHIPYEQAKETIYDAMHPLGEAYRKILREGFESRWIDVYQNTGKRSGAYSAGAAVHPFVLLNYTGTLDSQFTLAHEMGHALHSHYSDLHQSYLYAGYKIFVAEVASTCNEALLIHYLLKNTEDKEEKEYLINYFLDQFKGTLYRQTMFAEFEKHTHELIKEGKTLTAEVLCGAYKELNKKYFGPDMVVDEEIAYEWARIPHFYTPFYVYQYATGFAAAIAISSRILKGEDEAVPCTSVTGSSAYLGSARGENFLPVCGGYANIMYSPEKLHRAAKTKIKDTPRFER